MLNPLDLGADAPWKKRFRAPALAWSARATLNPGRGLVASNKDGVYQLYAWDTETDALRQLTDEAAGVAHGAISADGERVYYLRDRGGDEIGHYVSLPFSGGAAQDITPDVPDYASHSIGESHAGNALGFMAVDDGGFHARVYAAGQMDQPRFALTKAALSYGPFLSQSAEIALIASTEKTGVAEYALEAYDVESGALIGELWDGGGQRDRCRRLFASHGRSALGRLIQCRRLPPPLHLASGQRRAPQYRVRAFPRRCQSLALVARWRAPAAASSPSSAACALCLRDWRGARPPT